MADTSKLMLPVTTQTYHITDTFNSGTYLLIEGVEGKKIYITNIRVLTDTVPFYLKDESDATVVTIDSTHIDRFGEINLPVGSGLYGVFTALSTYVDMYVITFIV